jgi:hypothetical protein
MAFKTAHMVERQLSALRDAVMQLASWIHGGGTSHVTFSSLPKLRAGLCHQLVTRMRLCFCSAAWRLMGAEMYEGMSNLQAPSPAIERGITLHKMIRAVGTIPEPHHTSPLAVSATS